VFANGSPLHAILRPIALDNLGRTVSATVIGDPELCPLPGIDRIISPFKMDTIWREFSQSHNSAEDHCSTAFSCESDFQLYGKPQIRTTIHLPMA
jgi:hypothetical protein